MLLLLNVSERVNGGICRRNRPARPLYSRGNRAMIPRPQERAEIMQPAFYFTGADERPAAPTARVGPAAG